MVKMGAQPGSVLSPDGNVPQLLKDYYEAVARGGVALGAGQPDSQERTLPTSQTHYIFNLFVEFLDRLTALGETATRIKKTQLSV
jgi:hypothetical protein